MKQPTTPTRENLHDALQALPVVALPDDVWAEVERRTQTRLHVRRGIPRRWYAAAAAGVLAISVALLLARSPTSGDIPLLVAQSQQLEGAVVLYRAESADAWGASRRALMYRIADLDRDLAPLSVDPSRDPARTEALWRQRIALMQSLAEIDRAAAAQPRTVSL